VSSRDKLIADIGIAICLVIGVVALAFVFTDCAMRDACISDDGTVEEYDCRAVVACKDCPPSKLCDWRCIR